MVGGAYSTFGDAFNLNSASLPTVKMPIGVEAIVSKSTTATKTNFNIIKGFSGIGFGVASDSDNTIYSNRANHATAGTTSQVISNGNTSAPNTPTLSFGSALSLEKLLQITSKQVVPQLGLFMRYNSDAKNWSPGYGLAVSLGPISLGLSIIKEQAVQYYPATNVYTYDLGFKIWKLQAEYVYILNRTDYYSNSSTVIGLSGKFLGFLFTFASRSSVNATGGSTHVAHLGVQYVLNPHLSLSYLMNYVPGSQSLSAQFMF
jgi:hypothetical protein